ncbi:hypothetical protein N0V95_008420 [Ascochyta clinopodiicola]|nr:hypothetical protein N0V95_008420 [Ascochyta clinopodiicola]
MPDIAHSYAVALKALYGVSRLKKQYDDVSSQISREDQWETVASHLLQLGIDQSVVPSLVAESSSPNLSQSVTEESTSSSSSHTKAHKAEPTRQRDPSVNLPRRRIRKSPKVVIPLRKPDRARQTPRRAQDRPKINSQALLWRDVTESSEDSEPEPHNGIEEVPIDESSEDELSQDKPKPAKPVPRARRSPKKYSEHIDWVFWVQAGEVGHWKPFTAFPVSVRTSFKLKFDTDYLTKSYHIKHYIRMLRNRDKFLTRDICVGNTTYNTRSKPSKWTKTGGDKQKTVKELIKFLILFLQ